MHIKFIVTAVVCCVALFGSTASASSSVVEQGKTLYENRCLHCHGVNADGKGELIEHLNVKPANIVGLCQGSQGSCVTERVLKAVLGRHEVSSDEAGSNKMPLLKDYISVEDVHALSEYLKTKR